MKIKRFAAGLLVLAMLLTTLPTDLAVRAESFSDWYQLMPAGSQYHTVTFTAQGQEVYTAFIADGGTVSGVPSAPRVSGMAFIGWCYEGRLFSASTPVTAEMVIEAAYSAVDSALELQKQIAPYSQSAAGAYASLTVFGTPKKNHTPSLRALTGVAGTDSAAVLEAWTVDNLHKQSSITLEAVVTNRPELGRGQTLAAYTVHNGKLGSIIQSTLSVGSRVVVTLLPGSTEGIALVRLTSALSEDETVPGTDPAAPSEEEDEEEDDQLQDGVLWANDDLYITGRIPGNGVIDVTPVDIEINGQKALAAWDIKIYANQKQREKGKTWQPAGEKVHVYVRSSSFGNRKVRVYHIPDAPLPTRSLLKAAPAAPQTELVAETTAQDGWVAFDAGSFSVYAIVDESTEPEARMNLTFYSKGSEITTLYIKNSDTAEEIEQILYDPGVGELGENEVFAGWILDKEKYTTADVSDAMSIEQLRTWAEQQSIQEGVTHHRLDAAICKLYEITYKDLDGTIIGKDAVPVKSTEYGTAEVDVNVKLAYTPHDDVHKFEGWKLDEAAESNVASTIPADKIYPNDTSITIKGNISFTVNAPEGAWLIFDENGKGGKYNAPQFVKSGETTQVPCPDTEMTRNGYTFGGWYTQAADTADERGYRAVVESESSRFTFGNELTAKTTLYAKWTPVETAPYTVIMWGQRLGANGVGVTDDYDVLASYVNDNGTVGQNIPYTFVENGDEDYVTGVGSNGHYMGFGLTQASRNQQVRITPEGDAVLNLYYDRIQYNFKFYLYRDGTNWNRYDYANHSGSGSDLNSLVTWHSNQTEHPSVTGYDLQSERISDRTYYYFVLPAYYGEDISKKWPTYDKITGANSRNAVSYVMMVGTALKPVATNQGSGTVKGLITVMNENILGKTNDANGNYVVVRFPDSYYNWRYHIWFEVIEGEDPPEGKTTHTWNGKTYYDETVLTVRSSNTTVTNQNAPKYEGFDFVDWRSQNWNNRDYWTSGSNPTLYHINQVYNRQKFKISYFDGSYVDGNGNAIQNRSGNPLHESPEIPHGATLTSNYTEYKPTPPEAGYVFENWYLDEGCTVLYPWSTMPIGGITVYAKWRQVEYRVFLHPNAGTDPNLDWGSDTVSTSFRVAYGGKVSLPTGKREDSGYEFVGWYTDPSLESQYLYNGETELNDTTVTTPPTTARKTQSSINGAM